MKEEEKYPEMDSPCRAPEKVRNLRYQVPLKGRVGEGAESLHGDYLEYHPEQPGGSSWHTQPGVWRCSF